MPILTLTETAAARLRDLIAAQTPRPEVVWVAVKSAGCSGLSYDVRFLDKRAEAPPDAEQVNAHGLTILIDPKATLYLVGSTMDYHEDALRSGFAFTNPNEVARCGCGESFSVQPARGN